MNEIDEIDEIFDSEIDNSSENCDHIENKNKNNK